mmetsp:Transcript_24001/g.58082  ORF Transcript_24001/g.58082 Transcript_24001/m.58082 type:complete len:250 (-) Transcript_24001:122-871(-)
MLERTIIDLEGLLGDLDYEPMLWYHADIIKPNALPRTSLPLKPMRKKDEMKEYSPNVYSRLSGWGFPVQARVAHWLANQTEFEFAWLIEHDVYFSGQWRSLFDWYAQHRTDLIANEEPRPKDWIHWKLCDIASEKTRAGWGLYVNRISKRLSVALMELLHSGKSGHQECLFPTLCLKLNWCHMSSWDPQFIGILRFRPVILPDDVPLPYDEERGDEIGRLYHPVKLPKSVMELKAISRACQKDKTCQTG